MREDIGFLHFSKYATVLDKMSGTKAQAEHGVKYPGFLSVYLSTNNYSYISYSEESSFVFVFYFHSLVQQSLQIALLCTMELISSKYLMCNSWESQKK